MVFSGKKRQKEKNDCASRNSQNRRELTQKRCFLGKSYYTHALRHTYTLTK